MPSSTKTRDDGHAPGEPDRYDRYSHVNTETGEIIYDTEHDEAWIQADSSLRLEEWR